MRNVHTYFITPKQLQNPNFDIAFPGGRAGTPEAKAEAKRVLKSVLRQVN